MTGTALLLLRLTALLSGVALTFGLVNAGGMSAYDESGPGRGTGRERRLPVLAAPASSADIGPPTPTPSCTWTSSAAATESR